MISQASRDNAHTRNSSSIPMNFGSQKTLRLAYLLPIGSLLLVLFLQWQQGAYRSDFGAHPDEAAHVVTTLMVRDYLVDGLTRGISPLAYAESYYERFPKVALGHYPPGFYVLGGLWMLPVRSPGAILTLTAFLTALSATVVGLSVSRLTGSRPATITATLLFCLWPLVRNYTAIVMADMLLVFFSLLATLVFARFLETGRLRWSLGFGLLAAAAILTKGSGLFLAPMVGLSLLLSGRWGRLLEWRLWIAPLPILLTALPWMLFTADITSEGMLRTSWGEYVASAVPYFLGQWLHVFGFLLTVLFVGSTLSWGARHRNHSIRPFHSERASLLALAISVPGFAFVVPSGFEARYLLPAVAPVMILVFDGLVYSIDRLLSRFDFRVFSAGNRRASFFLVLSMAILTLWERHDTRPKAFTGASETANWVLSSAPGKPFLNALVSSDARGEGAFIVAAAFQAPDRFQVLRGSKELASQDWMGRDYEARHASPAELASHLHRSAITFVVIDQGLPPNRRLSYHDRLEAALKREDSGFELVHTVSSLRLPDSREPGTWETWSRRTDSPTAAP